MTQRRTVLRMIICVFTRIPVYVCACQDSTAALALDPDDGYAIMTKPHGHGDVHALMHSTGTAEKWKSAGCKWVVFMQVLYRKSLHGNKRNGLCVHLARFRAVTPPPHHAVG